MSDVERIKSEIDIVDVIGQYVKLEKAGKHFKGLSPFTKEKTPSFFVSPDKGLYHCFSTGRGGDMFTFVQEVEGLDFYGALTFLANQAGLELKGFDKEKSDKKKEIYDILEEATVFFEGALSKEKHAKDYLSGRGMKEKSRVLFRIGYAPGPPDYGWHELREHLKNKGFSEDLAFRAGLIKKGQRGYYDLFRDRVVFPIRDTAGRVIAFSGRILHPDENSPKYVNSPETPVFNKSKALYGYYRARQSIRKNDFAILVEGQMDLVLSHQAGFPNTVAVSGTSLTDSHLKLIKRLTDNILIVFDNDRAGWNSMIKSGKVAVIHGMNPKTVSMPEGEDPADIIARNPEEWKEYVRKGEHIIEALSKKIIDSKEDKRKKWGSIQRLVVPLIAAIPDRIDRSHFIEYVGENSGIPISSLEEEVEKAEVLPEMKEVQDVRESESKKYSRKKLIALSLRGMFEWIAEDTEGYEDIPDLKKKFEKLCKEGEISFEESDVASSMFQTEERYRDEKSVLGIVSDMLIDLEEELLKERRDYLAKAVRDSEKIGDGEEHNALLVEFGRISKLISEMRDKKLN